MRHPVPLLALSALACAPDAARPDATDAELAFCTGPITAEYDPDAPTLLVWPDDVWTRPDPASPTGLAVDVSRDTPWIAPLAPILQNIVAYLDGTSGFARQAEAVLRVDGDVGADLASVIATPTVDDPLVLLDLSTTPPTPVPMEVVIEDDGRQIRVLALRALSPGARHALVLTDAWSPPAGGCVAPSPALEAALRGTPDDPRLAPVAEGFAALTTATGWTADRVSAGIVFTTHDEVAPLRALTDDLVVGGTTWATPPACDAPADGRRRCEGVARVVDARDPDGAVRRGETAAPYDVPVTLWLPDPAPGSPPPLTMYAHGLNGRRTDGGGRVADRIVGDLGQVMVATDALRHGDHPSIDGVSGALPFLGIDFTTPTIDGAALRGNFVQTAIDRAQVLALLRNQPDIDGDSVADLDPDRIGYWGVSLGGLLAPALLALSDDIDAAVLSVGGAHLIRFATESESGSLLIPLLLNLVSGDAELQRLLIVAQGAVDAGEPAAFAPHVLADRLGARADGPHLLLPTAEADTVVPPPNGRALARALGLPHVEPVSTPTAPLAPQAAPWQAASGPTAGYFQLDRITAGADLVPADHDSTPFSAEATDQMLRFFEDWAAGGQPTIVDPYAERDTPPLP